MMKTAELTPDEGVTGWIYNQAKKHYWRVSSWYDYEDLVQDGILWFFICRDTYPEVANLEHFMALFKRCYSNHITDLAYHRTRLTETPVSTIIDEAHESAFLDGILGKEYPVAELLSQLVHAPREIKQVFELLLTDTGLAKLAEPYQRVDGIRETTNERLCRFLGYDPDRIDVLGRVRAYLAT